MAVITSSFSSTAGQVWASPTWDPADPSYKINTELTNWITAIGDPAKIEMIFNPGNATSRGSTSVVRWLLRAREADTGSDYGLVFVPREAGSAAGVSVDTGTYFSRVPSSSNNGAGTYSVISPLDNPFSLSVARSHFTAYEATGSTPWFAYSNFDGTNSSNTGSTYLLCRLNTSNSIAGSYYPSTGLGKWAYMFTNVSTFKVTTPQSRVTPPYIGLPNISNPPDLPYPNQSYGANYFFKLPGLYGSSHYLGDPSPDILVSPSTTTAVWGDTVDFSGNTYRCLKASGSNIPVFWVKVS